MNNCYVFKFDNKGFNKSDSSNSVNTMDSEIDFIHSIIESSGLKSDIASIIKYDYKDIVGSVSEAVEFYKDAPGDVGDGCVIVMQLYASKDEFSSSEYDYAHRAKLNGLKPVPTDEVIERDGKILESIGFENVTQYLEYEYTGLVIYKNKPGMKVIEYIKENFKK